MISGRPNRFASVAAALLLAAASALIVSGRPLSRTQPESRKTLHVPLESQRTLFTRTTPPAVSQSSPEQSRFTVPAVWAHSPAAEFSGWLQLSRAATRSLASGFEYASGRAPPRFL